MNLGSRALAGCPGKNIAVHSSALRSTTTWTPIEGARLPAPPGTIVRQAVAARGVGHLPAPEVEAGRIERSGRVGLPELEHGARDWPARQACDDAGDLERDALLSGPDD